MYHLEAALLLIHLVLTEEVKYEILCTLLSELIKSVKFTQKNQER